MVRFQAGFVIGLALIALGLFFGFIVLGPCDSQGCDFYPFGGFVSYAVINLISWGLMVLGIGILVASLKMKYDNRGGTTQLNQPQKKHNPDHGSNA